MPDWSDWPDVRAAQETDVTSPPPKYVFPWILHDNPWEPVFIDWLNQGIDYDEEHSFDHGWVMDITDSNYLWLDQDKGGGTWTDTDKEDTTWSDTIKGSTAWQKKDYWD